MPEAQAPSKAAPPPVLYEFPNPDELSKALASFVLAAQDEALKKQNTFKIAISGGSLPKVLGQDLFGRDGVKWDKWSVKEVFFADERLVPLDHEDSNFRANDEELFSKVPIPRENIHVIDTKHLDDPEHVADEYEKQMIKTFVEGSNSIAFPRFDLILLGIGPDGHTCSLFPGHELLEEVDGWVAYLVDSPKPPASRITLTFPVLNHAHRVAFVASGAGKQDILHRALDKPEEGLPCSRVKVKNPGQVYWFSDEAALKEVSYNRTPFESAKL
ncbi:BZ3500_MvSof-1268-A1-R1_Chr1-1g00910 [Microbotryum saponariae]|uniref:6-phosphogluconolactonase n=1 Tax=Microbotryum saponariae TaxID=289078 RepID=A0A2X0MKW7_9BASI|nr:BZ3500_MvSof-1268-A1-R1_Chr1-1g00910 [Microbotryum saponariae]SCZ92914.1 BZ3501_MvSof-1269-A2-R1_Chr1-1g00507 [Microbotryum saponariae]